MLIKVQTRSSREIVAGGLNIDIPKEVAMLLGPEKIETQVMQVPAPGEGEALLKVKAATTCGTDVKVFRRGGHPRMLKVPTPFGHEMAGMVAAVGPGVTGLAVGDSIVVSNSAPCMSCVYCSARRENLCEDLIYLNGAFAPYILIPERFVRVSCHPVPAGIDFGKAALAEPLACVIHGLDACELPRYSKACPGGQVEVVIYGAGPIGLLMVAALRRDGHLPILADPNPPRLEVGKQMGAHKVIKITRGGGQAQVVREATRDGAGAWVAVDCSGVPEVWQDAIASVRPGGLVNLFGGCAPGTSIPLDTHLIHYSEITLKGVYHHRPNTFARALETLAEDSFPAQLLLNGVEGVEGVEGALRRMMSKDALKVVISFH